MKKLITPFLIILIGSSFVFANNLTKEEVQKWKDAGFHKNRIGMWKDAGVENPIEAKKWEKLRVNAYQIKQLKRDADITTADQLLAWKSAGVYYRDVGKWKYIGIKDPKLAKRWKEFASFSLVGMWIQVGVTNPDTAKYWQDLGISPYAYEDIKKANLNIETINMWVNYGIKDLNVIIKLRDAGFTNSSQLKPYNNIEIDHILKLKDWRIDPNKLIENMSYINNYLNSNLFFENKETFEKAYKIISSECDEIDREKIFTNIDFYQNNDKCYIFVGKMFQRLDEKSLFGNVTQKGLVQSMYDKYFFVDSFNGSWLEKQSKIGIIKGDGSFSYNSNAGKQIVPKGTVLYYK